MLFEIKITDPMGSILLYDIFFMDSITDVMDLSTDLMHHDKIGMHEKKFSLTILSEKDCHIEYRCEELSEIMVFKNMLYDQLIEVNSTTTSQETNL